MQNQTFIADDADWVALAGIDVADYPKREHSFGEIVRAGKFLSGRIDAEAKDSAEALHAFKVAHNWRLAHALPMIIERQRLSRVATGGVVTAGRVKRMASIRKKLAKTNISLREMQDLGGCRAVMQNVSDVQAVVASILHSNASRPVFASNYLSTPKSDGYRGVHLVVDFCGSGRSEQFNGQKLEIQVRTKLQHSWSTAVEVIGAVLNVDMKGGAGDLRWRRLMVLMSDYYALCDELPLQQNGPQTHSLLCREIRDLDADLGALRTVTSIRDAMTRYIDRPHGSHIYMLTMDALSREVRSDRRTGVSLVQDDDFGDAGEQQQSVIVSVDSADNLQRAFPNFYLDVSRFTTMLGRAIAQRAIRKTSKGRFTLDVLPMGKIK